MNKWKVSDMKKLSKHTSADSQHKKLPFLQVEGKWHQTEICVYAKV